MGVMPRRHRVAHAARDFNAEHEGLSELRARLAIRQLPEEERGRDNTVAGLLMAVSGDLPGVGEKIDCAGWTFEVLALEGRRIDRVKAMQLQAER